MSRNHSLTPEKILNDYKSNFYETKIKEIPEKLKSLKSLNVSYGDSWY